VHCLRCKAVMLLALQSASNGACTRQQSCNTVDAGESDFGQLCSCVRKISSKHLHESFMKLSDYIGNGTVHYSDNGATVLSNTP